MAWTAEVTKDADKVDVGTYYLKRTKSGWSATNPDTEVVA